MQESQLVINAGSTTIKFTLFELGKKMLSAHYEKTGDKSFFKTVKRREKISQKIFENALEDFLALKESKMLLEKAPISQIGFRYVHGGKYFRDPVKVTSAVLKKLKRIDSLAPLHNPRSRKLLEESMKLFPKAKKTLIFDTGFHKSISEVNWRYALPKKLSDKYDLRVYGFHGIVCSSIVSKLKARRQLKKRMVICHLGGGSSVTAVRNAKSVKTSMGFSPLDGLVMTTRAGSLDPGILLSLFNKKMKANDLEEMLNHESGLKGLAGTRDMREILKGVKRKNPGHVLALEIYCKRAAEEIAKSIVSLEGIDQLIFSGGIGENAPVVRKKICEYLKTFGVKIHNKKNLNAKEGENFSKGFLKTKIQWVHADEASEIHREMMLR